MKNTFILFLLVIFFVSCESSKVDKDISSSEFDTETLVDEVAEISPSQDTEVPSPNNYIITDDEQVFEDSTQDEYYALNDEAQPILADEGEIILGDTEAIVLTDTTEEILLDESLGLLLDDSDSIDIIEPKEELNLQENSSIGDDTFEVEESITVTEGEEALSLDDEVTTPILEDDVFPITTAIQDSSELLTLEPILPIAGQEILDEETATESEPLTVDEVQLQNPEMAISEETVEVVLTEQDSSNQELENVTADTQPLDEQEADIVDVVIIPEPTQSDANLDLQGNDVQTDTITAMEPFEETLQDIVVIGSDGEMITGTPTEPFQSPEQSVDSMASMPEEEDTTQLDESLAEIILPEPSQIFEIYVADYFDIILPGQGWIYLGDFNKSNPVPVSFYARYIDGDDTLFNFYAENEGSTLLHFYKQDILANEYLDEYIEVVVMPLKKQNATSQNLNNRVEESFGISAEPEVSLVGGESQILDSSAAVEAEEGGFAPEDLLDEAQLAYDEERYEDSIYLLDEYTSFGVNEIDRALFLYGKNYEANSDLKNIRLSIASYEKLTETFPDSAYWDDANKRVVYLERFYLNIR